MLFNDLNHLSILFDTQLQYYEIREFAGILRDFASFAALIGYFDLYDALETHVTYTLNVCIC